MNQKFFTVRGKIIPRMTKKFEGNIFSLQNRALRVYKILCGSISLLYVKKNCFPVFSEIDNVAITVILIESKKKKYKSISRPDSFRVDRSFGLDTYAGALNFCLAKETISGILKQQKGIKAYFEKFEFSCT